MSTADARRSAALWALATAGVTVAPHTMYLPLWVSASCTALLGWQALRIRKDETAPGRGMRLLVLLLAMATAGGIRLDYGHLLGKEPGIALLAVLLCMKLLEGRSTRDLRAAILLALFLQLGLFFHDQTLPVAALALFGALLATSTLLGIEDPAIRPLHALRTSSVLMLQAIPFLLVLFVLFPRIAPLWGLPADAYLDRSGLSDEMAPGSIGELSLSDEIALRAEFEGEPPPPSQRYWRGPVLSEFDGRTWRAVRSPVWSTPVYQPQGTRYDYVAVIEPHDRRWLLALDFPGPTTRPNSRFSADYQFLSDGILRERTRVAMSSWPETPVGLDERPAVLEQALQLPEDSSPRTRETVARLAEGADSDAEILDRMIDFLRGNQLTYTLSPPLLGDQPVDEFLFDTQRGFCEHFSSAFVVMMRAAGVPSRVVTGYQGGTLNSVDGSMVVRQSDAHAWAEVWIAGRGWVRIDPTGLAAPSRIEGGLSSALQVGDPRPLLMRDGRAIEMLRAMRDRWEAVSNAWNRHIVGFDQQQQLGLLSRLGLQRPDLHTLSLMLAAAVLLLMAILLAWAVIRDALDRMWQRFCARLARHGLARLPSEGPIDYAGRVSLALPAHAATVQEIAATYARLRYGPVHPDNAARTRQLAKRIREFSAQ
jgi:protein-glutamine gamma-glutamyltransferase